MSDEALKKHMLLQQANQHNHKQPSKPVQSNNNPQALNVMDELFTRLKAISAVGNAFKTDEEEKIVKQEWMLAFKEEGVTKQAIIDDGLESFRVKARKSRSTTWFPSIGEFIDLCLGSDDKLKFAERALEIFINPKWKQKQICNIGQMVVSKHYYQLKSCKSSETNKKFIELYLKYAEDEPVMTLDAFSLTDGVTLSKEQKLDAEKRTQTAQADCMSKIKKQLKLK